MVNLIMAGNIKRPQLCIVNNNGKTRKNSRKHRNKREIESRRKTERINRKRKKNKRVRSKVRKQKCDKACTNRIFPSLPINSLLSSKLKDQRLSHLGQFFQSRQFLWQDFPVRLPTLKNGFLPRLSSVKKSSMAD